MTGGEQRPSLRQAVRDGAARLAAAGVPSPEADAVALAAHVLDTSAAEVRKGMVVGASAPDAAAYERVIGLRELRLPLQHLTGRAAFRRLELAVGPGVFVPRPETEVAAGLAIEAAAALERPVVVDLCTGSGAIALSVKDEVPHAEVHAVELSPEAYQWALRNRHELGLDVEILLGDAAGAFPELLGAVDVVVSNPPYIPVGAVPVDPEVRDHDPELALYGGSDDGLRVPLQVAARAAELLRPAGLLVMEHADVQGQALPAALLATGRWADVLDHEDLAGRPRVTVAHRA